MKLTKPHIKKFQRMVLGYYKKHSRDLPWRKTSNPYHIVVSEVMLQQTQVDRVVPKYGEFLKAFPTVRKLASASLRDVFFAWQGLGYNRRAQFLWEAAQMIQGEYKGKIPQDPQLLEALPGIGQATAASICAFAFNMPTVFVETNVRSVYIHYFFPKKKNVNDKEILSLLEKTIDRNNPARWYQALMDYGTYIKKEHGNPNAKSRHYAKQSRFEGSDRQMRGKILRYLLKHPAGTTFSVARAVKADTKRTKKILQQLVVEGQLKKKGQTFTI